MNVDRLSERLINGVDKKKQEKDMFTPVYLLHEPIQ